MHNKPNKLLNESSPYLLQHAYNPVEWYPWGEEALTKAKEEDKPIIVSIGYSACHWCHVMERECFEKEQYASLMNAYFVNIKVDREERPDLDQVYMDAVQAMGIHGGWPLNVFLTPEGKPFYGGTYFPPVKWEDLLVQIHNAFTNHRSEIEKSAEGFKESLSRSEVQKYNLVETSKEFKKEDLDVIFTIMKPSFDLKMGGTERAPKFPMPSIYAFLLRYYAVSKNEEALQHIKLTLDRMSYGGIYDQLGGGFARYSTDMDWFAPHFEKMLYDNAQLISVYSEAYQVTKEERYKTVVYETISWLKREMIHSEGGFYSALDADSEGVEGKFYVWEKREIDELLGVESNLFCDYYQLEEAGNWEHGVNILIKKDSDEAFASKHGISLQDLKQKVQGWKTVLMEIRNKRIKPGLDDKILASWNGMMLKGLSDAYRIFDEPDFLSLATLNATFIQTKMKKGEVLYRSYKNQKATIEGYLEDYAFTMEAFIALYQATFDEKWLNEAIALMNYVITYFYDEKEGLFYFTSSNAEKLIVRKKEIFDNVIPASNSAMARNLYSLGLLLYKEDWIDSASSMLSRMKRVVLTEPSYLTNWACLYADMAFPTAEIAIVGSDIEDVRKGINQYYFPNSVMAGTKDTSTLPILEGKKEVDAKTTIYVCYDRVCKKPLTDVQEVVDLLKMM